MKKDADHKEGSTVHWSPSLELGIKRHGGMRNIYREYDTKAVAYFDLRDFNMIPEAKPRIEWEYKTSGAKRKPKIWFITYESSPRVESHLNLFRPKR